jgi:hypothetical protein
LDYKTVCEGEDCTGALPKLYFSRFLATTIAVPTQPTAKNFLEDLRGQKEREILYELESLGESN